MKRIQLTIAACFTMAISGYAQHGHQEFASFVATPNANNTAQIVNTTSVAPEKIESYYYVNTMQEIEAEKRQEQRINVLPDAQKAKEILPHKTYNERPITPSTAPANVIK